jgi:cysteine desulfurase
MNRPIYLDYHATTPVDPRVLEAMLPYFTNKFGNAASRQHAFGWEAQEAVDKAREQVAALIGASSGEITFTSGASESNNLALKGIACSLRERGNHIVTAASEHKSVLDTCVRLERDGFRVTRLAVDPQGFVDVDALRVSLTPDTILVSVMAANNEIGTIQPLRQIGEIAAERGVLLHTDAAQAAGKIPIDVREMPVDLLSLTAHKYYGPKGAGALYVRRRKPRIQLTCQIDGGGHENGLRSGTLNVPGIVGLGAASEICRMEMAAESARMRALRDRLLAQLQQELSGVVVNGPLGDARLPHNLHVSFEGIEGERLLMSLGDIAVSTGSACSAGSQKASHVLEAIGASASAGPSIRFGLGRGTTAQEIETAAARVVKVVRSLRDSAVTA